METATATATAVQNQQSLPGTVAITLTIGVTRANGQEVINDYRLRFLPVGGRVQKGFCLKKIESDGEITESYDVIVEHGRSATCTCQDYRYRHRAGGCKHIRALHAGRWISAEELPN